jgi:hypothetical protein
LLDGSVPQLWKVPETKVIGYGIGHGPMSGRWGEAYEAIVQMQSSTAEAKRGSVSAHPSGPSMRVRHRSRCCLRFCAVQCCIFAS